MAVQRALLILADISGYTRFMKFPRMSLAHAQDMVARLLEATIDAARGLRLVEVEGDAAFLYVPYAEGREAFAAETAVQQALAMHRAFHTRQREITAVNRCGCDGCRQAGQLRLKFVAHAGEVAAQKVKRLRKLAGVDVIIVHRMLKNSVPVAEYLLMSEPLFRFSDERIRPRARELELELEGLGKAPAYFVDLQEIAADIAPTLRVTWVDRVRETMGVMVRGLPYVLGLKKPCAGFRNITA